MRNTRWTVDQLRESGSNQQRWLSLPGSRVVVNPFNFKEAGTTSPASYSNRASLPLNIGYLAPHIPASEIGLEFGDMMMIHTDTGLDPQRIEGGVLDGSDPARWTLSEYDVPEHGSVLFADAGITVTVHSDARDYWQYLTTELEVDLDQTPMLLAAIPHCKSAWSIKVAPLEAASAAEDIELIAENSNTGAFHVDIAAATGWRGRRRFKLRLYAYGFGQSIAFEKLELAGVVQPYAAAERYTTEWAPHELAFQASYGDAMTLEGRDFGYARNTVCRSIACTQAAEADADIILGGRYTGQVTYDPGLSMLVVSDSRYSCALRLLGESAGEIVYYADYCDYIAGARPLQEPPPFGYWQMRIKPERYKREGLHLLVAFPGPLETVEDLVRDLGAISPGESLEQHLAEHRQQNERFWNDYLDKVPSPSLFSLDHVPSAGVTPEQVEAQYYKAWIFLASNVLDVSPEAGYPYPQLCCGKPSLWGSGANEAPYSAAWESLFAIQLYAYIDPDVAWAAFKGLMSLVDASGMLGGESLPSRKAQTAMILYELTGDLDALRSVSPSIRSYLRWRVDNPRWILGSINDPNSKDSEFVVSALIDISYYIQIAQLLGMQEEIPLWQETYAALLHDYTTWFWDTPGGFPHQYYDVATGIRKPGCTAWVLTGVHLPSLESPYTDSLIRRFQAEFAPSKPFGGLAYPKHPDVNFDIYGLIRLGYAEEARQLIEVCIRDVTRSGFFAEQYDVEDLPHPTGVRPSIFGCAQLIECVLLKNGYRLELGQPYRMDLFQEQGLVEHW
ncbi:hypothetical protein PA598K_01702 [Paenibacillus sp. 598K]|uniref:hypothetical protein n=1 Tax=Paenibacillus sp. 598K TaxID=1117987 RepID=UPI000FFA0592|nr:hypothetical protein [Paenibacillus sp. 598K]GBF73413.1 hypothetical protein PA598K_01702 [Paenibacillus sp. 598K]